MMLHISRHIVCFFFNLTFRKWVTFLLETPLSLHGDTKRASLVLKL